MSAKRIVICLDGTWNNTYGEEKPVLGELLIIT
jgi:uncharacterized protein (DUF2235 family)